MPRHSLAAAVGGRQAKLRQLLELLGDFLVPAAAGDAPAVIGMRAQALLDVPRCAQVDGNFG